jgi:hypothetical protein
MLARMLRHLAAMNTIRETGPDTFAPTPLSNSLTESAYEDTILFLQDDFQPVHQSTPSYFKQHGFVSPNSGVDGPFQHAYSCKGQHLFEYFQTAAPLMGKRFASMMDMWSKGRPRWFDESYYPVKERLLDGVDNHADTFLVDIGGGSGHDIEDLRRKFAKEIPAKLVLQDRPEILALDLSHVDGSIERMPHDFLIEQPIKGERLNVRKPFSDLPCRRPCILSTFHHPRLERRGQHANPQIARTGNEEGLFEGFDQRLRRSEPRRCLGSK